MILIPHNLKFWSKNQINITTTAYDRLGVDFLFRGHIFSSERPFYE